MPKRVVRTIAAAAALVACGGEGSTEVVPVVPDERCPPGTVVEADASCRPAGVPPERCGVGFAGDGLGGCVAVLPGAPCPPGLMAVPGEESCRPVMPCPADTWGDLASEPGAVFVDASYAGGDGDGTIARPWPAIGPAVAAAPPGAVVAIAAGTYTEDIVLLGKPVRLRGVCPERVAIVATGAELGAVGVRAGADGTELRGVAIRGPAAGVVLFDVASVVLDRVWIHDTTSQGVHAEHVSVPTGFELRGSLLEGTREVGVFGSGVEAVVDGTVVRATQPQAGVAGRGVTMQSDDDAGVASMLTISASVVEGSHEVGVYVSGSQATLDAVLVRDTQVQPADGRFGRGIVIGESGGGMGSFTTIRSSVVERSHTTGIQIVGATATIEWTVVRDVMLADLNAFGISAGSPSGVPASLSLRGALVERAHSIGVGVTGSSATLEGLLVRDTHPEPSGLFGRAVQVQDDLDWNAPSDVTLAGLHVERCTEFGVLVYGSTARLENGLVRDVAANGADRFGDALIVIKAVGGAAVPSTVSVIGTRLERAARAGIANFGSDVGIQHSRFVCHAFDLDAESYDGSPPVFHDLGDNLCGCPEPNGACQVVSSSLEPPEALVPDP
jgi:hypothetical protein